MGHRRFLGLRRSVLSVLAATALATPVTQASAQESSDDNTAVAVNTKDGSSVFKIAFSVRRVTDGEVDQQNAAVAYSSCNECRTVAVAIQIVLVEGQVTSATPTNLAVALNENCTSCETMALAYQYVFGTGEEVELSPEGKARLKELRKRLHDAKKAGLTLAQLQAEVEDIAGEIGTVLTTELRPEEAKSSTGDDGVADTTTTTSAGDGTTTTTTPAPSSSTTSTTAGDPGTTVTTSAPG